MYRKLDNGAIDNLLEAGISEFAKNGVDRASITNIAKEADLSVGVIYKYYHDKDQFFLACVEHSLKLLELSLNNVLDNEDDVIKCMELIIDELIDGAEKHQNYYIMYNEITSGTCQKFAKELAEKIEGKSSKIYTKLVKKAQKDGAISYKGSPEMFAFFFDSLLMMLQFSFSCEYYKERLKVYCGDNALNQKDMIARHFLEIMKKAIGIKEVL